MNMNDRKSKMVSFRLSPEEYRQFRGACSSHGVRSISELARTAMQSLIDANGSSLPLYLQVQEFRERFTLLEADLERLARAVDPAPQNDVAEALELIDRQVNQ